MLKNTLKFIRNYSTISNKNYFISTPIFYVNASPHIGHLYSSVIADAVFRLENLINPQKNGIFSTGTDEHGSKIELAAIKRKIPVDEYCERISNEYKILFKETSVDYTDFIRTTENRHKLSVEKLWNCLKSKNHIHMAKYSGWYCVSDETFLSENLIRTTENGKKFSLESGHPVVWTDENNYIFPLDKFRDDIIYWIKQGNKIKPKIFEKILLDTLQEPLYDLSVSRPTSRVQWGIKVPDDDTQTIYVWLDALVNYLTCAGYSDSLEKFNKNWPVDVHVLGKDILKFHGIYWPAFLIAAGIDPPKQLLVHSHWTVDGEKMSKSKLNVVDPFDRMKIYTQEGLRYFLLREGVPHNDGNYSDTKILRILNSELADTLGNLLSRCCATSLNPNQINPKLNLDYLDKLKELSITQELISSAEALPDKVLAHYKSYNFHSVVDSVMALLHLCNNFVETTKPWNLKNGNNEQISQLNCILSMGFEILRISGIVLQPIIPILSRNLLNKINIDENERNWKDLYNYRWNIDTSNRNLGDSDKILFKRIISEKNNKFIKKQKIKN